MPQPVQKKVLY